ncbi:hypothetical protein AMELA_G00176310 [Ameiurus melas]|uniref:Uncharacterized protein n=1 Tax=Ameiurus melas TaxID=219545 RepID=A0A7J6AFR3_AMEME|nr:hypothetical protein AMELA_G00176310 [Ameiurus melas]
MTETDPTALSRELEKRAISQLDKDTFPKNARFLFFEAVDLTTKLDHHDQLKNLLDEMLHSILFLGNIHAAKYNPEDIFEKTHDPIMRRFPEPFQYYQTHVPLRTPFSYFLELVVKFYGQNNEETVKDKLSRTLKKYKESAAKNTPLISTVMCICASGESRHYGVSLSCGSDKAKNIMTAVSCEHVWHPKVSSAVMSVFPDDAGEPRSIKLPDTVRCRAYAIADTRQLKPPCKRCNQLYSLPDPTDHLNTPGNCAETEAISNFIKTEKHACYGNFKKRLFKRRQEKRAEIGQRMSDYFDKEMNELMDKRLAKNRNKYRISRFYHPKK